MATYNCTSMFPKRKNFIKRLGAFMKRLGAFMKKVRSLHEKDKFIAEREREREMSSVLEVWRWKSKEIQRITRVNDTNYIWQLRLDRNAFAMLCDLLKTRGRLLDDGNVTIDEQIASFINILAHHNKNRSIQKTSYLSNQLPSRMIVRTQGGDGLRRNWTLEEEDVMISILEKAIADGGRYDNGSFRSDALDNMRLETDESDMAGFAQSLPTHSYVASTSSAPNTEQTTKRKRKRNWNLDTKSEKFEKDAKVINEKDDTSLDIESGKFKAEKKVVGENGDTNLYTKNGKFEIEAMTINENDETNLDIESGKFEAKTKAVNENSETNPHTKRENFEKEEKANKPSWYNPQTATHQHNLLSR
ncbi:hypothetical protein Dsin_013246 [Dipteronia sinensis]|uniref:DUF8040 domain-containing protein n=1 Tax=Dipteronia sinensis TaxID=43782 RepID=A0AAE0E8T4_9ROSI|nr:hypothetical protein Dsin_013246 [Dipteronia sinensis]